MRTVGLLSTTADLTDASHQVQTTLLDRNGTVVDARSEQLTIAADGLEDGILSTRLRARKTGGHRVVTITGGDDPLPLRALSTDLSTADGTTLLSSFDEAPVNTARDFAVAGITFDGRPGATPDSLSLAFQDAAGGTVFTRDVVVENLEDEDEAQDVDLLLPVTDTTAGVDAVALRLRADGSGGWDLGVGPSGARAGSIAAVEAVFNEPFEGPSPTETVLTLDFAAEWNKWVETFESDLDLDETTLTVEQFVFTEEGAVVEEVQWTGTVGATYKNGKGTRSSASNTSTSATLL